MKKRWISLLIIPSMLIGCSSNGKLVFVPYTEYVKEQELMKDIDGAFYYSKDHTTPVVYRDGEINDLYTLYSLNKTGKTRKTVLTTGDRKILVVPICFTDSDTHDNDENKNSKNIFIENAFFGATKMTEYDSVAGYYNKSSYGQLRITGEVTPWYDCGFSSSEWKIKLSSSHSDASNLLVAKAIDYLRTNNLVENINDYDTDSDGYVDAIYAIYDHPFDENVDTSSSFFWAYSHYIPKGINGLNNTAPFINAYAWTSVNAITDIGNKKDTKSYTNYLIHETGHLFGLYDYYNSGLYQPTGLFDMMDYNIGDHSAFSKYLLKWTSPYVLKNNKKMEATLKPFLTSGDYILVPSESYANSPFGEYLLLEFFVPEELNKNSEQFEYTANDGATYLYRYPNHYGLKIYHVNGALGYYEVSEIGNPKYLIGVDDLNSLDVIGSQNISIDFIYNNNPTSSETRNGRPVLCHLLESSGENSFKEGHPASNETLFRVGDDFGITKFTDFTFSDGSKPNFKMKVLSISTKGIVLDIDTTVQE